MGTTRLLQPLLSFTTNLLRAFQVGPHRFFLTLENETVKGSLGVKRCSLSVVRPRIKVVRGRHELSSRFGSSSHRPASFTAHPTLITTSTCVIANVSVRSSSWPSTNTCKIGEHSITKHVICTCDPSSETILNVSPRIGKRSGPVCRPHQGPSKKSRLAGYGATLVR